MSPPAEALRAEFDALLEARDRAGAVSLALDAVTSGRIDVESLYYGVLTPVMTDTGAAWQAGTTRVWEEHFASATVRIIVDALYPEVQRLAEYNRTDRVAVLACPPEEQHDLGLRMLSDRMEIGGWNAFYLGPDTPVAEIAAAAETLDADLIVLSAATHYHRVRIRRYLENLSGLIPDRRIVVGGPAFADPEGVPEGVDLFDPSLVDASAFAAKPEAAD